MWNKDKLMTSKKTSLLLILLFPLGLWIMQTGDVRQYFGLNVPSGQLAYVFSKLFGMLALTLIMIQVIVALLNSQPAKDMSKTRNFHKFVGMTIFLITALHIIGFFTASSLRQERVAFELFLPSFKDYYHLNLALGMFAFIFCLVVIVSGRIRSKKAKSNAAKTHKFYGLMIFLAYIHALSIGSESQTSIGFLFYVSLAAAVLLMATVRLLENFKARGR